MAEIYINRLSKKQRAFCTACKGKGTGFNPTCKLAVTEVLILKNRPLIQGRLLKPQDARERGIEPNEIPDGCGNLYGNLEQQFAQTYS